MTPLQEKFREAIVDNLEIITDNFGHYAGMKGKDEAAIACSEITLEMMGKFAEWIFKNNWRRLGSGKWINTFDPRPFISTSELIQKFLNETK